MKKLSDPSKPETSEDLTGPEEQVLLSKPLVESKTNAFNAEHLKSTAMSSIAVMLRVNEIRAKNPERYPDVLKSVKEFEDAIIKGVRARKKVALTLYQLKSKLDAAGHTVTLEEFGKLLTDLGYSGVESKGSVSRAFFIGKVISESALISDLVRNSDRIHDLGKLSYGYGNTAEADRKKFFETGTYDLTIEHLQKSLVGLVKKKSLNGPSAKAAIKTLSDWDLRGISKPWMDEFRSTSKISFDLKKANLDDLKRFIAILKKEEVGTDVLEAECTVLDAKSTTESQPSTPIDSANHKPTEIQKPTTAENPTTDMVLTGNKTTDNGKVANEAKKIVEEGLNNTEAKSLKETSHPDKNFIELKASSDLTGSASNQSTNGTAGKSEVGKPGAPFHTNLREDVQKIKTKIYEIRKAKFKPEDVLELFSSIEALLDNLVA